MGYVNREGKKITSKEKSLLMGDEDYSIDAEYENDRFLVIARWNGFVKDMKDSPPEYWKPFELWVGNKRKSFGDKEVKRGFTHDPSVSQRFATASGACLAYRQFLSEYTDCGLIDNPEGVYAKEGEDRIWHEPDNKRAKVIEEEPIIISIDAPSGSVREEEAGSW